MFTSSAPEDRWGLEMRPATFGRMRLLATAFVAASIFPVFAGAADLESTPLMTVDPAILEAMAAEETLVLEAPLVAELPAMIGDKVTIGLDFEMSTLSESGFIPPDTMGAVGPEHIVQTINGRFEIFDKFTGAELDSRGLSNFWGTIVGLTMPNGGLVDPRIVYDPDSERWFALGIDRAFNLGEADERSNNIFFARTDTDDPTGPWQGFRFDADTVGNEEFHDYPTLAVDADGLYSCTQDFGDGGNETCYSLPKADLLLSPPSSANLSRFEDTPAGLPVVSGSIQPALDFGISDGRAALLGVNGGALVRSNIFGAAGPGAFLDVPVGIAGDPGHASPPAARQPHPTDPTVTLENVAPRFVSNVVEVDNSIWAVHAVAGSGANSALRWYEIDETTNTVLQTGLINDESRDFHEPSIAVNELGNVVIGYTCSGPTLAASTCVSVGETDAGVTTLEPPAILFTGLGHYYRDFCDEPDPDCSERNRWGDYSATVVDPVDSCTFWTFQEYVSESATGNVGPTGADGLTPRDTPSEGGQWATRVTELTFNSCSGGDLRVLKDCKPETPLEVGGTAICTIYVDNLGPGPAVEVTLIDSHISDGTFSFGDISPAAACTETPNPQVLAGDVTCELGNLAPGERVTITVEVTADTPQDVNDVASVTSHSADSNLENNHAADTVSFIAPSADLIVTKQCKPDDTPADAGTTAFCEITVRNAGASDAVNVDLFDDIRSEGAYDVTSASAGCAIVAGVDGKDDVSCNFASIAAGASELVRVEFTSNDGVNINDEATATSDTADPNPDNNTATGSVVFRAIADLELSKSANPVVAIPGEPLTYTLTVENVGVLSTAENVVVTDVVPAGLEITSISSSVGSCVVGVPGNAALPSSCNFGPLAPGGVETMTIVTNVLPETQGVLNNNGMASSATYDPNTGNNNASVSVPVTPVADIQVSKIATKDPVTAGDLFSYVVTVFNDGPSDAVTVSMTDTLPAEVALISFGANMGGVCENPLDGVVVCDWAGIAAGGFVTATIDVQVLPETPDATVLANNVVAGSDTFDDDLANNEFDLATNVEVGADLWMEKTGNFPANNPSGTIIYRLTVHNEPGCTAEAPTNCGEGGPSDAENVVVVDTLPSTRKKLVFQFATEGCLYDSGAHAVTCDFGTVPVGTSVFADIQLTAKGGLGEILNTATVSSSTPDPEIGNNTHTLLMIVQGGTGDPGGPGGGRGKGPKK